VNGPLGRDANHRLDGSSDFEVTLRHSENVQLRLTLCCQSHSKDRLEHFARPGSGKVGAGQVYLFIFVVFLSLSIWLNGSCKRDQLYADSLLTNITVALDVPTCPILP
jgi:hypothetical protein